MGCDIHPYIEVRKRKHKGRRRWAHYDWFRGRHPWDDAVSRHPLYITRDYNLFGVLAGVRVSAARIATPRGLPPDVSRAVRDENQLRVVMHDTVDDERVASYADAVQWVKNGSSEWVGTAKRYVTHPDHHSHSYVTLTELLARDDWARVGVGPKFYQLTIPELCTLGLPDDVRLVFWFDN